MNFPAGLAVDDFGTGNLYFADSGNNRIRQIATNGVITTVAGSGPCCTNGGFSGDGGPATSAQLSSPWGVAVNSAVNIYIADSGNNRVRKVSGGIITTVAGNGSAGFSGDNGQAVNAQLNFPQGLALDSAGNLYISDTNNHRIRKVATNGVITTYAGNGNCCFSGDGGPATSAQLQSPLGLAFDAAGNLYFADYHSAVRIISPAGIINTVAGGGPIGFSGDGGPAKAALLGETTAIAVDAAGDIYAGSYSSNDVRFLHLVPLAIGSTSLPTAFNAIPYSVNLAAGGGHPPYTWSLTGGTLPSGLTLSTAGVISGTTSAFGTSSLTFKATDSYNPATNASATLSLTVNNPVPSINSFNAASAVAGSSGLTLTINGSGFVNGVSTVQWSGSPRTTAFVSENQLTATITSADLASVGTFNVTVVNGTPGGGTSFPAVFTVVASCSYQLSSTSSSAPVIASTGSVTVTAPANCAWTAASNSGFLTVTSGSSGSGNGTVSYSAAGDSTVSSRSGTLTIAGQVFTVSQVVSGGPEYVISTFAGNPRPPSPVPALSASLGFPQSLVVDATGNIYVAVPILNSVFKLDISGVVTRIAGNGTAGFSGDGGLAVSAQLFNPNGVTVDAAGNIYIADSANGRIRKVTPNGVITTVAGTGCCYGGDGGQAVNAQLNYPQGVAFDTAGNMYIADTNGQRIRMVSTSGIITTVAGNGGCCSLGDGGPATSAQLNRPVTVAVDSSGNV